MHSISASLTHPPITSCLLLTILDTHQLSHCLGLSLTLLALGTHRHTTLIDHKVCFSATNFNLTAVDALSPLHKHIHPITGFLAHSTIFSSCHSPGLDHLPYTRSHKNAHAQIHAPAHVKTLTHTTVQDPQVTLRLWMHNTQDKDHTERSTTQLQPHRAYFLSMQASTKSPLPYNNIAQTALNATRTK